VELSYKSLNEGDGFILDSLDKGPTEILLLYFTQFFKVSFLLVIVWYGKDINKIERGAASKFATDYKNEARKGYPTVFYIGKFIWILNLLWVLNKITININKNKILEPNMTEKNKIVADFWTLIGGKGKIASEEEGGNDIIVENEVKGKFKLFRCVSWNFKNIL